MTTFHVAPSSRLSTMKTHSLIIFIVSLIPFWGYGAFDFPADGTNVVHVVYDGTLPAETEAGLDVALQRILAPSLARARVVPVRSDHPAVIIPPGSIELEGISWVLLLPFRRPAPSSSLKGSGTNFTLRISTRVSDYYRDHEPLYASHAAEIAKADAFQRYLSTNDWTTASSNALCSLRLTKACAPGEMTLEDARASFKGLEGCSFYPPSALDFELRVMGPGSGPSHKLLWGAIPAVQSSGRVMGVPIVYYQNRWWISYWFWEEGEQEW